MADGHDAEPVGETIGFFKKPSPPSSVDVDDASSVSTGFNADFVLECAAGFQTERDELSSSSTNRSQRQSVKDELSTSSNNRSQRQRRNLPTLEEFPGSVTRPATYVSSNSSHRSPSGHPGRVVDDDGLDKEKVKSLNNTASGYALRGDERRALKTYKQALRLTRIEIARINHQMQLCKDKPSNIRATIHILLHDEWTEVALIIAEIRTMMAIIYERIGDYDKAISCCKEARDIHERQSQFDEKHMYEGSMAKEKAQRMSHMAVKMEQAKSTFSLRRRLHKDVIHYHRKISMSQEPAVKEELYKTLFEKITAALELELESLGQNHPQVADTMTFLAKVHLERDDVGKALDSMTQAVSIAEVSLGTSHPRTGEKYHEVAQLYEVARRDKEDVKKAILFHEKAIASFKNSNMDEPRKIGSILNDVAVLHIRLKEYDRAVHKLSDALACYGTSSVDDEKEVSVDTVQVWRNLAECYVKRKAWESATMAFKSALEVQRDARKLFDATRSGLDSLPRLIQDESIAETLNRLGKSYAEQKRYQSAHKVLLEALVLFRSPHEKLQTPEAQDNVASVLFGLAKVKEGEEKENEAIRLYTESLQLRRSSDKQRPKDKKRNHVHCAMCMAGIGSVRMNQQHYGLAFKIFNDALRSSRRQSKWIFLSFFGPR